jgi:hypothetical protein
MDLREGEPENQSSVWVFRYRRILCVFKWLETKNRNGTNRCFIRVNLRTFTCSILNNQFEKCMFVKHPFTN